MKNFERHNNCGFCNLPVKCLADATLSASYWQAIPFIIHKACKEKGEKEEAIECQIIDADCNDCKFFQRGELSKTNKQIWNGTCLKFNKSTIAQPKFCSNHLCFEHRKL